MTQNPIKHKRRILVVVANDFQIPFHDPKALKLFRRFLAMEKPNWLILNGDFMDFWEISSFDRTPLTGRTFLEEISTGRKILRSLRRVIPKARITWIEGNHEFRVRKYLIRNAKELYGLSSLTIPALFNLRELKIKYKPCGARSSSFTDNYVKVGNLYVGHWNKVAKQGGYAAKALVEDKSVSLLQGHTQRFGAHARTSVDGRVLLGIENFSMCERKASYVANPNWQVGFSVIEMEPRSGRFQWFPILMDHHRFYWHGMEFKPRK